MSEGGASVLKAGLLSGLLGGLLVATPLVSKINDCCCGLVILTGIVAAWMLRSDSQGRASTGSCAGAGLLGGIVAAAVGTPLHAFLSRLAYGFAALEADVSQLIDAMRQGFERWGQPAPSGLLDIVATVMRASDGLETGAWLVLVTLMACVAYAFFGLLGGLLGAALTRRAPPAAVPPAPAPPMPPPVVPHELPPPPLPAPADGSGPTELRWGGPVLEARPPADEPEVPRMPEPDPIADESRGEIPPDELPLLPREPPTTPPDDRPD